MHTRTGGPFGTIRNQHELAHEANRGLDIAIRLLEPIKEMFPIITYADFYQVCSLMKALLLAFLVDSVSILSFVSSYILKMLSLFDK